VVLPDELMHGTPGCLAQMVETYKERGGNVVAVQEVPHEHTSRYGVIDPGADDGTVSEVRGMVEKPKPDAAPSNLAIVGRYILQPDVFVPLSEGRRGAGDEIQLTDAMAELIGCQPFHAPIWRLPSNARTWKRICARFSPAIKRNNHPAHPALSRRTGSCALQ
jgi:UTP--glucose-1-phosphate uridylyltransferase